MIKQLESQKNSDLINIIVHLANVSSKNEKSVYTILASQEPSRLANLLEKEIKSLNKMAHTYDYKQGHRQLIELSLL